MGSIRREFAPVSPAAMEFAKSGRWANSNCKSAARYYHVTGSVANDLHNLSLNLSIFLQSESSYEEECGKLTRWTVESC